MAFPQNSLQGSVLVGSISYGKLSFAGQGEHKNPEKHPASYRISYIVPPNKVDLFSTLCTYPLEDLV
jgi:tripeptidyl-peptidase II